MAHTTRRAFMVQSTALTAAMLVPGGGRAQSDLPVLRAMPATAQLAPQGYPGTEVWAYGVSGPGTVPGPEIRVTAGEAVRYRLQNDLPQATAVHWHGIRIDNAMDGAAPLTQAAVAPGDHFDYDFVAPDPGTYWYHSHNRSFEQVARGLSGPLIVEDTTPWAGKAGAATRDLTLVLDDWLLNSDAAIVEDRWDDLHAAAHAGRLGNTVTVNGAAWPEFSLRPGERIRLRLINTATARVMSLALPELGARLIAVDGHPVTPRSAETLVLAPAQRADVIIDAPAAAEQRGALLLDPGNGEWVDIAGFLSKGDAVTATTADLLALPAWPGWQNPDLVQPQNESLVMEGGAMRGLEKATYQGRTMDFRELVSHGMAWTFNGTAHGMAEPMFTARQGRTVRMKIENRTRFAHAVHLHGHHFQVLTDPHRDVRDTVLIGPDQSSEIAFVADNPGKWMIHCHMLGHQVSGMMGWFSVA